MEFVTQTKHLCKCSVDRKHHAHACSAFTFERHLATELLMDCLVDRAHAADADLADHAVAADAPTFDI